MKHLLNIMKSSVRTRSAGEKFLIATQCLLLSLLLLLGPALALAAGSIEVNPGIAPASLDFKDVEIAECLGEAKILTATIKFNPKTLEFPTTPRPFRAEITGNDKKYFTFDGVQGPKSGKVILTGSTKLSFNFLPTGKRQYNAKFELELLDVAATHKILRSLTKRLAKKRAFIRGINGARIPVNIKGNRKVTLSLKGKGTACQKGNSPVLIFGGNNQDGELAVGETGTPIDGDITEDPSSPLAVGDLNNDNNKDVVAIQDGKITVLQGTSDGSLKPVQQIEGAGDADDITIRDVNGDKVLDIVKSNPHSATGTAFLGNGDGTFSTQQNVAGRKDQSQATADVNGDNKPDQIKLNENPDHVTVIMGDGDGNPGQIRDIPTGANPNAVMATDMNGDNNPDLVVNNPGSGDISVLPGNGDGTFGPEQIYSVGDSLE